MSKNNVFQLSALSQNDSGASDGNNLYCKITNVNNGKLRENSFPTDMTVRLPIPPQPGHPVPPTPTWFLLSTNDNPRSFSLVIFSKDSAYPTKSIDITESEVEKMLTVPFEERENVIYQDGEYGIIGFATEGPDGPIYTITVGILNPRLHGN